jgi:ubiquinone/menaquinone biosynthesis C-methylase UbiE
MDNRLSEITSERFYYFHRQDVVLEEFEAQGLILDIGGGSSGTIGRMKTKQVVAIDLSRAELEEAPPGPLKIVMDASNMLFLDCSFNTATAFYSFMYIGETVHEKVFKEVFRILTPGGQFLVWDADLPERIDPLKDVAAFPLRIIIPEQEEITTGYGTAWPDRPHDMDYYLGLAENAGFKVISKRLKDQTLFLELQKPFRP